MENLRLPLGAWVEALLDFIGAAFGWLFDAIALALGAIYEGLDWVLVTPPFWLIIIALAALAYWVKGWKLALGTALGLFLALRHGPPTAVLALAEFVADKVPGFDSVWDGIHTFVRIPAGAILAAAAFGNLDPQWMVVAGLIGGTLAGTAHAAKAGTRALINVSPEPFSNWAASFTEDVTATGSLLLAFFLPVLFFVLLAISLLLALWLLPKLWRGVRKLHGTLTRKGGPPATY